MSWQQILPFLVALAIGLLLGLERERSHSRKLPAGSRTFALLSLVGAVAASFNQWAVLVGLIGVTALLATLTDIFCPTNMALPQFRIASGRSA